ncbi:hypothetical protein [Mycobacteroides abscessus]|uniref:hypothetical protein n=1 Tax=Mycobacteroides abscessus TaxID=36809 RepID=UPI0009A65A5D|nr:hypothetical protein [Mycobacteroides abscessus]SKO01989.1 Uncharacterised protein [Mycobacteroides abscessus subsp. massiliense]
MPLIPPDRYDGARRAWIARHEYTFGFQKRRAELLNRQIRDRARALAVATPDPHDDKVMDPIWARVPGTATAVGAVDVLIVSIVSLTAPVGWLAGVGIYNALVRFIPDRLRSYPIPALLWTSAALGVCLIGLYEPGENISQLLIAPWMLAQLPAAFLAAGVYGILNGWLAVDGSAEWWPVTPPTPEDDPTLVVFGPDEVSSPAIFQSARSIND